MVVFNSIIPFKGYKAINLFEIIFARKECKERFTDIDLNHEKIHTAQMRELLYIGFYLWYLIEWFILLFKYGSKAYRNIRFEKEAYANEDNLDYLKTRKHYAYFRK